MDEEFATRDPLKVVDYSKQAPVRSSRKKMDREGDDEYEPASQSRVKSTYRAAHVID